MQSRTEIRPLAAHGHSGRAVVRDLLVHGPRPRAELARRLRLSPAALTKVTRELLESGAIQPSEQGATDTGGRPGVPLEVAVADHQMVGVKVTGDGVYAVRTDALGCVMRTARAELTTTDVDPVVAQIIEMVKEVAEDAPVEAVGIGLAGAMARFDDRVRLSLYLGWDDVPLADAVERACGLPTVVSNDVRALTAGVHWSGPGRGHDDLAVVTTGVGLGLGLVVEGRTHAGVGGRAGMIGHHRVDPGGPVCDQGHRGCASSYLTTAAITGAVAVAHGEPGMTLERVCELADAGDGVARRVLDDAGRALGVVVASLVDLLELPLVILAGDGIPAVVRARDALERSLAEHLDAGAQPPEIRFLMSDFDEWARGAAVVASQWVLLEPARARRVWARRHQHEPSRRGAGA